MRDVARLAGVSQSTVSRVLSDAPSSVPISEATRARIFEAVEQLGYRPNMTARSLRTQRTCMISVMIADISNPFYHFIVRAIQHIARAHDYDVLIYNTDHRYDNERHFCEAVLRRPVDGVIMVPYHLTDDELDALIRRAGVPVAVLGQHVRHPAVDVVFTDDEGGSAEAVRLLIRKRHRRIGYIGVEPSIGRGVELRRLLGYERALEEAGLAVDEALRQDGDFTPESGRRAMRALLALPDPPTAVFACNDLMALGAIDAALSLGRRVPQDVAVVGFDNIPEATLMRPYLTTVAQKPQEIGQKLIEALLERMEGGVADGRRVFEIPYEIIERQST
ncbi:MAG: LacI family DNA-binding transcriptional regulator [Anaerolineae bacterium]